MVLLKDTILLIFLSRSDHQGWDDHYLSYRRANSQLAFILSNARNSLWKCEGSSFKTRSTMGTHSKKKNVITMSGLLKCWQKWPSGNQMPYRQ